MGTMHGSWRRRWLVGVLLLATGCATTPGASPLEPPAPPTSAAAGDTTIVAIAPPAAPCCPPPSILDFLGITQIAKGVGGLAGRLGGRLRARLGTRFPGLESKPALTEITDPANMGEDASPAQQAAASAKAEEDAAPQKAKALKYLASLGCGGCYPDVEDALLSAMEDCTEAVRFAAVSSIRETTFCPCVYCNADGCCSPKVQKALREAAYETRENGCYKEPSARVRRMARIALVQCSCIPIPVDEAEGVDEDMLPEEGPTVNDITQQPTPAKREPTATEDSEVQLASFEGDAQSLLNVDEGALIATVNGQPLFMRHILQNVNQRWGATSVERQSSDIRAKIITEETERAIDDLLLHQLRSANIIWNPEALRDGSIPTTDLTDFNQRRMANRKWLQGLLPIESYVDPAEVEAKFAAREKQPAPSAAARWEQITIRFDEKLTRDQAYRIAAYLRSRMLGAMVDAPTEFRADAVESKAFAWKTTDEIGSPAIAQAVFGLPLAQVSPVIEDGKAWHLLRVLERRSGQRETLESTSEEIRGEIVAQRVRMAEHAYFSNARKFAIIWKPQPAQ